MIKKNNTMSEQFQKQQKNQYPKQKSYNQDDMSNLISEYHVYITMVSRL